MYDILYEIYSFIVFLRGAVQFLVHLSLRLDRNFRTQLLPFLMLPRAPFLLHVRRHTLIKVIIAHLDCVHCIKYLGCKRDFVQIRMFSFLPNKKYTVQKCLSNKDHNKRHLRNDKTCHRFVRQRLGMKIIRMLVPITLSCRKVDDTHQPRTFSLPLHTLTDQARS